MDVQLGLTPYGTSIENIREHTASVNIWAYERTNRSMEINA
jgi:hypothetical protein